MRKLLSALAVFSCLGFTAGAQTIPNVPDTGRIASFAVTSTTSNFDVPFALYGDCSDLTVTVGGVLQAYPAAWNCVSKSGSPLSTIARPITDAQVQLVTPAASTTVVVTGNWHPRWTMGTGAGVTRTEFNRDMGTLVSKQREFYDFIQGGFSSPVLSVNGRTGAVTLSASDVGLGTLPLVLTNYGVASGGNANAALQAALTDCGTTGRPVYVPSGTYTITATSNWPTANNNCPGIFGDGNGSLFQLTANTPVIRATVQTGVGQLFKDIHGLRVQGVWGTSPTTTNARLIDITGASDGWAYSYFGQLQGEGVHDIIRIATTSINIGGGLISSLSGWNRFDGLAGYTGSQGVTPDSFVNYADSTSTGNIYENFRGDALSGTVYAGGGASMMVGDIIYTGAHLRTGRLLYVGGGSTCPQYQRTISVQNVQVDATSTELVKAECGIINNIKMAGNLGGSNPWQGINSVSLSEVHDLGESHWGAGGPVQYGGTTGAHTAILWDVYLAPNTMARVEVSLTGNVGGTGGGGSISTYDIAMGASGAATVIFVSGDQMCPACGSIPGTWPAINVPTPGSNVVRFNGVWTDTTVSSLNSAIVLKHGAAKVVRGANVVF